MAPARKSRRQAKTPAKLEGFIHQDSKEKDKDIDQQEPRRSRRTPKLSEKLKSYIHEKESLRKEKAESQLVGQAKKVTSPQLSAGVKNREVKVVVKKLPNYTIRAKTGKQNKHFSEVKVAVKRLTDSTILRKTGNIPKQSSAMLEKRTSSSSSVLEMPVSAAKGTHLSSERRIKKIVKRNVDMGLTQPCKRPKDSDEQNTPRSSSPKHQRAQAIALRAGEKGKQIAEVNKEIMNKLMNFGADVTEAMAANNDAIFGVSTNDGTRRNLLSTLATYGLDDYDDDLVSEIITLLEEEENQRRAYRKEIIMSLKASHKTNMALYSQILQVFQSVSSNS